MLIIEKS